MIGLYRDPTGERVFEKYGKSSSKSQVPTGMVAAVAGVDHDSIDTLKRRVKELEGVLSTHVCHIASNVIIIASYIMPHLQHYYPTGILLSCSCITYIEAAS